MERHSSKELVIHPAYLSTDDGKKNQLSRTKHIDIKAFSLFL